MRGPGGPRAYAALAGPHWTHPARLRTASGCCAARACCSPWWRSSCSGASAWSPSRASCRCAWPRWPAAPGRPRPSPARSCAVAWLASAAGSALTPLLGRFLGVAPTAGAHADRCRVLTVVAMGLFAGVAGLIVAYMACYAVHGTSNAAHTTLLHRQADGRGARHRGVAELHGWPSRPARSARSPSPPWPGRPASSTAMWSVRSSSPSAAPLYLPAWRQSRAPTPDPNGFGRPAPRTARG